ncbi:MAG: hypothetical protein ABI231_00690 [Candidatus Tumulicola sp.]
MMFRYKFLGLAIAIALIAAPVRIQAQQMGAMSDSDYIAKVMTGAPASVVKGATIVEMGKDGAVRTLQTGTNGFTCMMLDVTPGCADQNAMSWMHAIITHGAPPNSVGFMYMLAGDSGASNTDPAATVQTAGNHWVKTGPHVMILGPSVKTMGYPMTADPDPSKPYVMWADTPYAHIMIPVTVSP